MATTHVFIVDSNTFKYHLEYQFAGTGAGDNIIDFNNTPTTKLHHATENNLVGMIADFQRIRKDDFVVFYVQKDGNNEGKFFGIFQARQDLPFLDNNDSKQFLKKELDKSLTFRTLIKPHQIYAKGVTEWEALDTIKNMTSPNQMLWSLIYRKLKATRGNTMITLYESDRLFKLLRDKNSRQELISASYTYDFSKQEIAANIKAHNYTGRNVTINILPRLITKYNDGQAFETHLQAYIVENIGRNTNPDLDNYLLNGLTMEWLGNEVYCGVGMQRIDVAISLAKSNLKIIEAVELKAVEASPDNIRQLQRYVDWLEQYYLPNKISDIQPVLISKKIHNKKQSYYLDIIKSFQDFNSKNSSCLPLKYIEFELVKNDLEFKEIVY